MEVHFPPEILLGIAEYLTWDSYKVSLPASATIHPHAICVMRSQIDRLESERALMWAEAKQEPDINEADKIVELTIKMGGKLRELKRLMIVLVNLEKKREQDGDENVAECVNSKDIGEASPIEDVSDVDYYSGDILLGYRQLMAFLSAPIVSFNSEEHGEENPNIRDPACNPAYWVIKWVDYSVKYGLGYQLRGNSAGVFFNDHTKIVTDADGKNLRYIECDNSEHYHTLDNYPTVLEHKMALLRYFCAYMTSMMEHLSALEVEMTGQAEDMLLEVPSVKDWFRTGLAIMFHLSNGTLQINFMVANRSVKATSDPPWKKALSERFAYSRMTFKDRLKLILCPATGSVTCIEANRDVATYKFVMMQKYGCPEDLRGRLVEAKALIERLRSRLMRVN